MILEGDLIMFEVPSLRFEVRPDDRCTPCQLTCRGLRTIDCGLTFHLGSAAITLRTSFDISNPW